MKTQSNPFTNGEKKMTKLKIEAVAVLNEDKQEFFTELMKKGVDAIKPEMDKQLKKMTNLEKAKELKEKYFRFLYTAYRQSMKITMQRAERKKKFKKEAKDLKEKIENDGCRKRCFPQSNPDNLKCGTKWTNYIHYCPKCLKAIKICEEILK